MAPHEARKQLVAELLSLAIHNIEGQSTPTRSTSDEAPRRDSDSPSLLRLPVELLEMTFSHLGSITRFRLRQTCFRLRAIIKPVHIQTAFLDFEIFSKAHDQCLTRHFYTLWHVPAGNRYIMWAVGGYCPRCDELRIIGPQYARLHGKKVDCWHCGTLLG